MIRKWVFASTMLIIGACGGSVQQTSSNAVALAYDPVAHGRQLVIEHDCGGCHGGGPDPAAANWLRGDTSEQGATKIAGGVTRPRNITPDVTTGIGKYTDRQIFNALRFGLRPDKTPDVEITSDVPGQGNFPANPQYLGIPMPWASWRHMSDQELRAIVAYLKRGVKPVVNKIPDFEPPPNGWAEMYKDIGPRPALPFPTENEVAPAGLSEAALQKIKHGRFLVISHACGDCHGGGSNPAAKGWIAGVMDPQQEFKIGPFTTRPRNLTPDNTTGMGRFSERQIFNALRFGLRPGETPDVEITSTTPGQGNHPMNPKYLAVPMPWPAWRHMSDDDLRAIAAYLKQGVKPFKNKVEDSEGPPDFWASEYTVEKIGAWPAPPFPTANEVGGR